MKKRVALVGGRGYVGAELLRLLEGHPDLEVVRVTSRELAGSPVPGHAIAYTAPDPQKLAVESLDVVYLAGPNGESGPWVAALNAAKSDAVIVDLGADHRFDDKWTYGQPERRREQIRGARRIANPGCYATAMQLALDPIVPRLAAPPVVFGISGYSGAGTTPSPKNDPDALRDNVLPYAPIGHVHEREVTRQLGIDVRFHPHVAAFFHGITLTISATLTTPTTASELCDRYRARFGGEPLVHVSEDAPLVRAIVGKHHVAIGGFAAEGPRVVLYATIDNLLGGAATQALRNTNLALGWDERTGIR